jgi:hypothetical protein
MSTSQLVPMLVRTADSMLLWPLSPGVECERVPPRLHTPAPNSTVLSCGSMGEASGAKGFQ